MCTCARAKIPHPYLLHTPATNGAPIESQISTQSAQALPRNSRWNICNTPQAARATCHNGHTVHTDMIRHWSRTRQEPRGLGLRTKEDRLSIGLKVLEISTPFSKSHIPICTMQVYFAQSWLSLDIHTLITTSLSVLNVQGTGPCQTNMNKVSVSHIFQTFLAFSDCFQMIIHTCGLEKMRNKFRAPLN